MREFVNAETNHLGLALPKGKLRFYRRDADGQMEFVGEDMIDHTPRNETIRVTTGNAFDLVGERKQTNFRVDTGDKWLDESFEIKLRNRKQEPVEFRVVEHLYRWNNWEVTGEVGRLPKRPTRRPSSSACRSSPMRSGRRLTRCIIRGDPGWSSRLGTFGHCLRTQQIGARLCAERQPQHVEKLRGVRCIPTGRVLRSCCGWSRPARHSRAPGDSARIAPSRSRPGEASGAGRGRRVTI